MTGPIFVGGAARSGKTLVRWMLSSHPRIVVTRRTEMWPRFYGRFGDLGRDENLERCLSAMIEREHIARLEPNLDALRRDFRLGERTYARLFALVHERYAERCGKARWGDQTAIIERFAEKILAAYPGAKVIHLVRDPRDRFEALLGRGPRRPGAVGHATAGWLLSASLAERNLARYPDSYRVVRYETLVTAPEVTVRELCAFLGEAFDPAMLRMDAARRYEEERAASADGIPISTGYVGRYRQGIGRVDLAFIQAFAGRRMRALGYPPDPIRLSAGERIRYAAVDWPVGLTRLGSRRVLDALGGRAALHPGQMARAR